MAMSELTKCPRCGGSMFLHPDPDDWRSECLQCGYRREPRISGRLGERLANELEELLLRFKS